MSKPKERTTRINGKSRTVPTEREIPILLNGDSIHYFTNENYYTNNKPNEVLSDEFVKLSKQIDAMIEDGVDSLPSCVYSISVNNIVVNTSGKIVYYETNGIQGHATNNMIHLNPGYYNIPDDLRLVINTKITEALRSVKMSPLIRDNKRVPYYRSWATTTSKGDKTLKAAEPVAPKSLHIRGKQ